MGVSGGGMGVRGPIPQGIGARARSDWRLARFVAGSPLKNPTRPLWYRRPAGENTGETPVPAVFQRAASSDSRDRALRSVLPRAVECARRRVRTS